MKSYKKYKDSGVEWIGEIPEHWETKRFKYWANYQKGKIPRLIDFEPINNSPIYLSMDYLRGENIQIQYAVNSEGCVFIENNDILLLWDGANAGEFVVGKDGVLSSTMVKINPLSNIDKNFCWFCLKAFEKELRNTTYGMGIPHVNSELLKNSMQVVPPIDEQITIANYLNSKTAEIDQNIANKEQLINLYEEEKKAIINEAVTKGLNPKVKLKSSGIDWLGEVPEHWEVKKLKYLVSKIGSGVTPKGGSDVYELEGIPLLRSQNIYNDGLRLDDVAFINEATHNIMKGSKVKANDILLNITGASLGRCYYFDSLIQEANVNQHVCIIRVNEKVDFKFLRFCIISDYIKQQIENSYTGSGREGLSNENLGNFYFGIPPLVEQTKITSYIEIETSEINNKINLAQQEIELLKEYRQALIFEAITGKIDVTNN